MDLLLEDVPIAIRRRLMFIHDGASAHLIENFFSGLNEMDHITLALTARSCFNHHIHYIWWFNYKIFFYTKFELKIFVPLILSSSKKCLSTFYQIVLYTKVTNHPSELHPVFDWMNRAAHMVVVSFSFRVQQMYVSTKRPFVFKFVSLAIKYTAV